MTLLLYAITDWKPKSIQGAGLQGRPLWGIGGDGLTAVVSDHHAGSWNGRQAALLEYERVVERLNARGAVLPARFGTLMRDEAAARDLLRARRQQLLASLDRVRDAVELGVQVRWHKPAEAAVTGSGTAYMLERLERHRRSRAISNRFAPLRAIARRNDERLGPAPDVALAGSYLVGVDRVEDFLALIRATDDELDEASLVCTGPWPPYSFCEGASP